MSNALTREQLVSGRHTPHEVEVEKLGGGGIVYVRPLSVGTSFRFNQQEGEEIDTTQRNDLMVDAVLEAVCDESGEPQLTQEHRDAVLGWPVADFNRIAQTMVRTSGLTGEADEVIEGNSENGQS